MVTDSFSELQARVAAYEKAWNTREASAIAAFFTEDADMIFGNGPRLVGREAIKEWWDVYFAMQDATRTATFGIESMRMITPEVALINIDSTTAGRHATGEELSTRLARGTWMMVRRAGDWRIAALRGLPAEDDVRAGPGRDR